MRIENKLNVRILACNHYSGEFGSYVKGFCVIETIPDEPWNAVLRCFRAGAKPVIEEIRPDLGQLYLKHLCEHPACADAVGVPQEKACLLLYRVEEERRKKTGQWRWPM